MISLAVFILGLSCLLVAGIFFAFSTFIMQGLDQAGPASAVRAMQGINRTVYTPWFMLPFLGTAPAALALTVISWLTPSAIDPMHLTIASACYILGTVMVTGLGNVPWNHRLAAIDAADPASELLWRDYLRSWQRFNHLRTVMAACAGVIFLVSTI